MRGFSWLLLLVAGVASWAAGPDPAELARAIESSRIDPSAAVRLSGVNLDLGSARLEVADGLLFPAAPIGARAAEMVLLGDARLIVPLADEIEANQLELFTGERELSEPVDEAVLVVCLDAASTVLLDRPGLDDPDPELAARAVELYDAWREGAERRLLGVEGALLLDAIGDVESQNFFAGSFHSEELGRFIFSVDPTAQEQVTLGQFTPLQSTDKEKRKLRRFIHKQQRQGRLLGVELDELGTWDTWVSTRLRDTAGNPFEGRAAFEPRHYALDVTVESSGEELSGTASLMLESVLGESRAIQLDIHSDLLIEQVRDGGGRELFFSQEGPSAHVLLQDPVPAGETVELRVDYRGKALEKVSSKVFRLIDTTRWYPHAGTRDRATYELKLTYPRRFDLLASGRLLEEGQDRKESRKWQTRRLDTAGFAVSFELGDFDVRKMVAGDVQVSLAFDRLSDDVLERVREEVVETIRSSMDYYQQIFEPYPLDHLTIVTSPRLYSQGLPGFVTLSDLLMRDLGVIGRLLGIEDRRTVIAHEIAHQWWGNLVGWKGYRDEWISEAMANYSAMVWAKNRLPKEERPRLGPTTDWQNELTDTTATGHVIESMGPVTLGRRLDSSLSPDAYSSIVYKKGAVVLNMLGNAFGEETFLELLRELTRVAAHKQISTEDFMQILERASGTELDWFADQYMFGTGLPEVYYRYAFEPLGDGKWKVRGHTRQQTPYRHTYAVRRLDDGRFDVLRETVHQIDVNDSSLSVPVQIAVHDPTRSPGKKRKKKKRKAGDAGPEANGVIEGRLLIQGERYDFDFDIGFQPVELKLDSRREVFGRFFSEVHTPKRVLYYQGLDRVAAGDGDAAVDLFRRALQTDLGTLGAQGELSERSRRKREESLDIRIHAQLAWLFMDRGDLDAAEGEVRRIRSVHQGSIGGTATDEWLRILEGRLWLLQGDAQRAHRRLSKGNRKKMWFIQPSGYALLAIAAKQTGDDTLYERALEQAERRGIDLAVLE